MILTDNFCRCVVVISCQSVPRSISAVTAMNAFLAGFFPKSLWVGRSEPVTEKFPSFFPFKLLP